MRARVAASTLLMLLGIVLAAGCTTSSPTAPPASVGVTASPTGAPSTGVSATPSPGPPTVLLFPNTAVTVVVQELEIYAEPSRIAESVGRLVRGDVVVLMESGPVEAEGGIWYYAMKIATPGPGRLPDLPDPLPEQGFPLVGWIAAIDGGAEGVAVVPPRCPDTQDFANVSAMLGAERLACFGAASITLDGRFRCLACGGAESGYEPSWLAGPTAGTLSDQVADDGESVGLHLPPLLEPPAANALVRVTGHFDDPMALTCRNTEEDTPTIPAVVIELCRQRFVVDSFEPLSVEYIPPPD